MSVLKETYKSEIAPALMKRKMPMPMMRGPKTLSLSECR